MAETAMNGAAAPAASPAPAAPSSPAPSGAGASATGIQSAAPGSSAPAPKPEPVRFKFKNGDQEVEWSQEEVQRNFQIGHNADRRMNDVARKEKALAQREAALTGKDPAEILRALGLDPDGWAFGVTEQALQRQQMPAHERKLMEAEAKAKALEEKLTARERQEQQQREEQELTAAERELESGYLGALEEFGFRPQSDPKHKDLELGLIVPLMAQEEHFLSQAGLRVTPQDLAARVNGRLDTLVQQRLSALPPDKLYASIERLCGPGTFNKLAQHALSLRRAPQEPLTPAAIPQSPPSPEPERELTPAEDLAQRRSAFTGRWTRS